MSAEIKVVPALVSHITDLARHMRDADKDEVNSLGHTPATALYTSLSYSKAESWTILIDDKVAAMGGVMCLGLLQGAGVPWLLTGKLVDKYPVAFYRITRKHLAKMMETYTYLTNLVDSRYTCSLLYLRRLGFRTDGEVVVGGVPFVRVVKEGKRWA